MPSSEIISEDLNEAFLCIVDLASSVIAIYAHVVRLVLARFTSHPGKCSMYSPKDEVWMR